MNVNVIKTVTVRGKSEGLAQVKAGLDGLAASQDNVARSGETMARRTETSVRRQLSAGRDYQRLMERHDRMIYLQTQLARETATVNRAFEQGAIDASQQARAIDLVNGKYRNLIAVEQQARAAAVAATAANDNQAASLHRLAAANDNARGSVANIGAQFQDVAVTAAMGMNPIMIALQQGTQLSAVLMTMQSPLRGLAAALVSVINPVSLLTIGFIALAAAAVQWFMSASKGAEDAESALKRHDEWLDSILDGYESVREAAKSAGEEARRLPQEVVELDLAAGLKQQAEELRTIDRNIAQARDSIARTISDLRSLEDAGMASGSTSGVLGGYISQIEALRDLGLSMSSTNEELRSAMAAARDLFHATDDSGVRDMADEVFILANQLFQLRGRMEETEAAQTALNMTDLSGMEDWSDIANDARLGLSLVERAAIAAAWAIANSGEAAVVAAGQYGTATGAANAYANAMFRLGSLIPEVAAAQAQFGQLKQAESDYSAAIRENQALLDARGISLDEFARRQSAANDLYQSARDQVTGLTDATKDLADAERQASIGAMEPRDAAVARIRDQYAALEVSLKSAGAGPEELARAAAAMNQEIANSNASFDEMATKASGAAAALKAAEKDFNSFIGTADKLAESLFPAEYARREAAELMALLDQYRDKLDSFQVAAVEREVANLNAAAHKGLRRLEDRAKETGDAVWQTLGSVLGNLFDGPMDDMDAFFDKALAGFAQLGRANLSNLFGGGESGQVDAGNWLDQLIKGVETGAKDGTADGAFAGLAGFLKQNGGLVSAGVGGLGIGAQTQNPLMGALGGALSGFAAGGPIGAVVGGIAGLIGGLFGMNEALQKARQKVDENRSAIEQFIASANGERISRYAKILADFQKQSAELITLAESAQDWALVEQLRDANENVVGTLGRAFQEELEASINALRGDDYLNQAAAAQQLYNDRLADAARLGVSADGAITELSLSLRRIIEDGDLTADQVARLIEMFPGFSAELERVLEAMNSMTLEQAQADVDRAQQGLREAYNAEAEALRTLIDRNRQFIRSLSEFKESLRLDSSLSGLSPMDRFLEAQRQFNDVSARAMRGDESALARLEEVSRAYLTEARGYYASSDQYFAIFGQVEAVLDRTIGNLSGGATIAERQLASLDEQVGRLIDINQSVMSVADAIDRLNLALRTLATIERGGTVPLPGFATGGSFMIGGHAGIDQNLLSINGRPSARVGRDEIVNIQRPGSSNDNSSAAVLSELQALRQEVASLRGVTAAGAKAVVEATEGTTDAVRAGNRQSSQSMLKRG
jgi:hypothetical protein